MIWFWSMRTLFDQERTAAALEAAAYMRWVETRERRSPTDEEVDLWVKGSLDRDGFAFDSEEVKVSAILALRMNIDLVHAFITSTDFFDALDELTKTDSP